MYTWEIINFIADRHGRIGGDDLELLINPKNHSQITYIEYNAFNHEYTMCVSDCFEPIKFYAMPIDEAKEKCLVKKIK